MNTNRNIVAELANSLYNEKISYLEFISSIPPGAEKDREIFGLLDLIEHEPQSGGLFGPSEFDCKQYMNVILQTINKLRDKNGA